MKAPATVTLVCLALAPVSAVGEDRTEAASTALVAAHANAAGTLTVFTPEGWVAESRTGQPERTEVRGDGLVIRILRWEGELGLDSVHVQCMVERLAGPMRAEPQVDYDYDFREGRIGERRALDSAFIVHYDEPIDGHRDWRQRNVTVVGEGESLCVMSMIPHRVWKKSKETRTLLEAVMASVRLN